MSPPAALRSPNHCNKGTDDRPSKQKKLSCEELTEPQEFLLLDHVSSKQPLSSATKVDRAKYQRRMKVAKYAKDIKQKRTWANKVKKDWDLMPISAQKGMVNLTGALCYRNSLLQVLLHLPKFVNWILDYHRPELCVSDDQEKCLSCCLRSLAQEYWKAGSSELSKVLLRMDKLFKSLGWAPDTQSGQADPDEQAAWMLGIMRNEFPASTFAYLEAFLQLVTSSTVHCAKCSHESRTDAHNERSLSVPIMPRIPNGTLSMYLQNYMDEVVDDYRCEGCSSKGKKHRLQRIGHGPDILVVQLKRFSWNGTKNNSAVRIDTSLSLDKFRDANNKDCLQYELTAIIKHAGSSNFGHYICSAKGPDGNWYCFDDQKKSKSSVSDATVGKSRFTPYLLFFQRKEE